MYGRVVAGCPASKDHGFHDRRVPSKTESQAKEATPQAFSLFNPRARGAGLSISDSCHPSVGASPIGTGQLLGRAGEADPSSQTLTETKLKSARAQEVEPRRSRGGRLSRQRLAFLRLDPLIENRPGPFQGERPGGLQHAGQRLRRPDQPLHNVESLDEPLIEELQEAGRLATVAG